MKRIVLILLAFAAIIVILNLPLGIDKMQKNSENDASPDDIRTESKTSVNGRQQERINCRYYNEAEFMSSVNRARKFDLTTDRIFGGVVPHHLLAADMMAGLFKAVSVQRPEIVVIIGPNHKRLGDREINMSKLDWSTPHGIVKADRASVDKLTIDGFAALNSGLMEEEHSIAALIPYIKYYMPDTAVLPLLVNGNLNAESSKKLGDRILEAVGDKNLIVIASIDFSHYLSSDKADEMDKVTSEAVISRDIERISRMGNDNLDSSPSMIALLTMMEKLGADNQKILESSNSFKISGSNPDDTTSYFTMVFYKK